MLSTRVVQIVPFAHTTCSRRDGYRCVKPKTVSILQWASDAIMNLSLSRPALEALFSSGTVTRHSLLPKYPIHTRSWTWRLAQAADSWPSALKQMRSSSTRSQGLTNSHSWARDLAIRLLFRGSIGVRMSARLSPFQPTALSRFGTFSASNRPLNDEWS